MTFLNWKIFSFTKPFVLSFQIKKNSPTPDVFFPHKIFYTFFRLKICFNAWVLPNQNPPGTTKRWLKVSQPGTDNSLSTDGWYNGTRVPILEKCYENAIIACRLSTFHSMKNYSCYLQCYDRICVSAFHHWSARINFYKKMDCYQELFHCYQRILGTETL